MNKITSLLIMILIPGWTIAQEGSGAGNEQNFRFGLNAAPSINWYKPDNTKKFENGGTALKFSWGANLDFRLSKTAWLSTGLNVMYDGGNVDFKDTVGYWMQNDEFRTNEEYLAEDSAGRAGYDAYRLSSRKYNVTYVSLPFNIKMKTKEIGMLNYYGVFGLSLGIKVKGKVNDEGYLNGSPSKTNNEGLDNSKDMGFFRAGINIGGGAEWNLSGTTSLVFGLQYNLGFTNVVKGDSEYLNTYGVNLAMTPLEQKFASHNIALTIGVLF